MSGNLYKTCEDDDKSGTIDEGTDDTEKSGTIDRGSEDKENNDAFQGFGEDEAQSGALYIYGEEGVESGMFDEISDDGNFFGSTSGSSGFDSKMSLDGETGDEMVGGSIATQNIVQILERITVGQIYSTKKELQHKLRMITIFQNFDYTTYKSTKSLLVLKCFVAGCSWKIRASTIKSSVEFKVRKYIDIHTCSATERCSRHRQATSKCIGELYLGKFGKIGLGIRPIHIMDVMKAMYGIDIDYWKSYKALVHARELERGTWESGYEDLPLYLQKIEAANPGTVTKLVCDEKDRFRYLFIAFDACIRGFQFIRNVIVVDGAHLKGKFKGIMLVAASQDGNGEIFPLAFGIVDSESYSSWKWFLIQLRLVYGDHRELAIISDRHKSIRKAVRNVFPLSHHGICIYHMHQNLLKKFKESSTLKLVKKAAKVYRVSEFITLFEEIQRQAPNIAAYLEKADVRMWARAFFQGDRYDVMTSNIAESINKVLKEAREYPIAYFLEEVRKVISRWFMERRKHAISLQTSFTPRVERTLTYRCKIGNTLTVQHIDTHRSHVTGGVLACVVDTQKMSCTCHVYDIDKIPCEHALASAGKRPNLSLQNLVHPYYTKRNLCGAYAESINPVDVEWESHAKLPMKKCLPPGVKRGVGRPKKSRYLSALERAMGKQPPMKKMKTEKVDTEEQPQKWRKLYTCSNCKQAGHNRATCKGG